MKTNKSYSKRVRVTKNGKILARHPGLGHFNAKKSRTKQLGDKKSFNLQMTQKQRAQFLPRTGHR